MLFNSSEFLLFLPTVLLLYFGLPGRWRWLLLLLASYFFYMWWKPSYAILILVSTITDYFIALRLHQTNNQRGRQLLVGISLSINLGLLFFFKYFNFVAENIVAFFNWGGSPYASPALEIILPVGISFYTFQTLAYTIDVYRQKIQPERHFGIFALYVSFWPQLVAGPIERAGHLLPQFRKNHALDYQRLVSGLNKMAYGFFKKVVVADRLSIYVNEVFGNLQDASSITVAIAVFFFGIQIYCDFSGYSDIAIGAARIMGFDLMENFKRPYLARSLSEFWRRWHISLSTWFRDYVYIPLGGNRVVKWRWYYNLFITFLVSGLWHGAAWTFVIWGGLHGIFLILEQQFKVNTANLQSNASWWRSLSKVVFTFLLVNLAWIFFRAADFQQAIQIFEILFRLDAPYNMAELTAWKGPFNFALSWLAVALLAGSYFLDPKLNFHRYNIFFLISTTILILLLGENGQQEFIYFQF